MSSIHKNRSRPFSEEAELFDRIFSKKLCMATDFEASPCEGQVIAAHTIPRSQLKQIAVDGHVFGVPMRYGAQADARSTNAAARIGIGQFSTFRCFCRKHDNDLFSEIEDKPLVFTPRQLAFLHYRTFSMEFYKMLGSLNHTQSRLFRDKVTQNHLTRPEVQRGIEWLTYSGIEQFEFKQMIETEDYKELHALIVYFNKSPSILVSGGISPEFSYSGENLRTRKQVIPHQLSYNVLVVEGKAALAITWHKGHESSLSFAQSFLQQSPERYATSIIQTAFEFVENLAINTTWWLGLKPAVRDSLMRRFHSTGMFPARKSNSLTFPGVVYDDWSFDRYHYVNV
jgi:hypothetical protein